MQKLNDKQIIQMQHTHMLDPNNQPTDLFTARGSHVGCGQCCPRVLPLTDTDKLNILHATVANNIAIDAEPLGTVDMRCPLLDLDTMQCRIYDERPVICQTYSCATPQADIVSQTKPLIGNETLEDTDLRSMLSGFERNICDIAFIITNTPACPDADFVAKHMRGNDNIKPKDLKTYHKDSMLAGETDDGDTVYIMLSNRAKQQLNNNLSNLETFLDTVVESLDKTDELTLQTVFDNLIVEAVDARQETDALIAS